MELIQDVNLHTISLGFMRGGDQVRTWCLGDLCAQIIPVNTMLFPTPSLLVLLLSSLGYARYIDCLLSTKNKTRRIERRGFYSIGQQIRLIERRIQSPSGCRLQGDLVSGGQAFDGEGHLVQVALDALVGFKNGGIDADTQIFAVGCLGANCEGRADLQQLAGGLGAIVADGDVAMGHELTSGGNGAGQTGAPYQVVQAGFQQGQHIAAGVVHAISAVVNRAQGSFANAVVVAQLLLFAHALGVLGQLGEATHGRGVTWSGRTTGGSLRQIKRQVPKRRKMRKRGPR